MLRITMSDSGEGAANYFDKALATGDYYTKDAGTWGGKGAERLGLQGEVARREFLALASNKMPGTNKPLTVRTKDKRTAGYDFCFSVPKSISLYLAESGNAVVERMVEESLKETLGEIESRMETRIRTGGQDSDRISPNMIYAWFVHRETRPIDGMTDPHFHIHAYVFNATFDEAENRWKAAQFMNLKADAPFYEAMFNARLSEKLLHSGYAIRRTDRDFELASVGRELIEKFSKRTMQIEEMARRQYTVLSAQARDLVKATGMEFCDAFAMVKSQLGAKSRKAKTETVLSVSEQLASWRAQMTQDERDSLRNIKGASQNLLEPEQAKNLTLTHLFERSSIARELHVAGMLLRRGIGQVSVEVAKAFAATDPRFIRPQASANVLTTREVLHEESETLAIVEAGRGQYEEIGLGKSRIREFPLDLTQDQAAAIEHILHSRDLVTEVRGVAGSGKTTMLQQAVKALADLSGKDVLVFAPSSSAVQVLKDHGFGASETVQGLMKSPFLQDIARGKILLVDEAGFLSANQMLWIVRFSSNNGCRLILCGDTRQHHAVERGDSLRVLENVRALKPMVLNKIFRQKTEALREAISELANGKTLEGFDKLDQCGVIHEVQENIKRMEMITTRHIAALKQDKSALIVAPTHAESREIARAVRQSLKKEGLLQGSEHTVNRLEKLNLTAAQRQDAINYEPGHIVEFHKRATGGFKSGEQWKVVGRRASQLVLEKDTEKRFLSLSRSPSFNVYKSEMIPLSVGDKVRITKNFKTFRNNELHTVNAIKDGEIILDNAKLIPKGGLHIDQGFVVTSHAAQGKTVDQVIVSVPIDSFSQVNQAQFYVSMSRARETMHLFTDSKIALRDAVTKPSGRLSPLELIRNNSINAMVRIRCLNKKTQDLILDPYFER